jgi:hypothetical protein
VKISKLLLGFFITTSFISCVEADTFTREGCRLQGIRGTHRAAACFLFADGGDIFTIRLDGKN